MVQQLAEQDKQQQHSSRHEGPDAALLRIALESAQTASGQRSGRPAVIAGRIVQFTGGNQAGFAGSRCRFVRGFKPWCGQFGLLFICDRKLRQRHFGECFAQAFLNGLDFLSNYFCNFSFCLFAFFS
ncbi:MAG: hypothetical protein IPJ50_19785 [Betaproteobacteria bacterium]|nr:hypothetical protein [Betaproteobacteria bacterium]